MPNFLDEENFLKIFLSGLSEASCEFGECLRAQGFEGDVRDCWQKAVLMGFDIADTRWACELLELQ